MDESLYDEFGNYIGPELPDSEDDSEESEEEEEDDIEPEDVTALVSMFALQRLPVHACSAMRANLPGGAPPNGRSWGQGNGTLVEHGTAAAMDVDSSSIVLHEDKKYYPDAADVFAGAETVVLDEDAQPIEEPLIAP
eukprot:19058-Heterococcus_DN1.PRE.1